jgi:hypothetical protein
MIVTCGSENNSNRYRFSKTLSLRIIIVITASTLFKLDYSKQLFPNQSSARFMEPRSKDSKSNPRLLFLTVSTPDFNFECGTRVMAATSI